MKSDLLIVTADDFGLATEVNEAVELAHQQGILSAASLMVGAAAAQDAIARATRLPNLRVGLHVVLVDGRPMLQPDKIPDLVDSNGRLRSDLARFGAEIALSRRVRGQLAAEIETQFEAFLGSGLVMDHVSGHKHFHLHPTVTSLLLTIGRRYGLRAVRVPKEPLAVIQLLGEKPRRLAYLALSPWQQLLSARIKRAGLRSTDAVFGMTWTGCMTHDRVQALLAALPAGSVEIYMHPAVTDDFEGHAHGYQYHRELSALTNRAIRQMALSSGRRMGGYQDLQPVEQTESSLRGS